MSSYRKTMRQALEEMYPPVPASLEEQVVVELDEDVATMAMAVMGLNAAALLPVLFMAVRELIRGTPLESSIKKVVEKLKKNKNYKMSDSEKSDVKGFVSKVKKEKPSLLQKAMKKFKEEVELDEGTKQVLAHGGKGKYKVTKDGDTIEIKFGGKVVGTADFDRGADSFFVSIKGEKGQKSFDDAQAIADYFAKNKITEEDELDEASSLAQQAAIAISKKERDNKPKKEEVELDEAEDFKPHKMYDPETGKAYDAETMEDHLKYKEMGYTHEKPEVEESAASDARRAIALDPSTKQKFSKNVSASDDDVKSADKNIMMQMRKAVSLRGNKVEFMDKKKVEIPQKVAQAILDKYNSQKRPADKEKFQTKVSKSYKDMLQALKETNEKMDTFHEVKGLMRKFRENNNG